VLQCAGKENRLAVKRDSCCHGSIRNEACVESGRTICMRHSAFNCGEGERSCGYCVTERYCTECEGQTGTEEE
jgi:hypothetical protein